MKSRSANSILINKENVESLKKVRIIQQNLIHVQGLPRSLNNTTLLQSSEYFGQYGTIRNITLSKKINPENNREVYSVYITYENKIQAAIAILCVDSLLIYGKILLKVVRAFFGTTKYCNYFLDNKICPNTNTCKFLHILASNQDMIIDDNNINFSYNEHLNMAKKIIELSNIEIKNILKNKKKSKNILPPIDFVFLTEEQKEKYFDLGNISYIKSNCNRTIDTLKISDDFLNNNFNIYNINNVKLNIINNLNEKSKFDIKNFMNFNPKQNVNIEKYHDPDDLYNIFDDSINHILFAKPFYEKLKNIPLIKLEYDYLKYDLFKKGIDINLELKGCLDCIKD